MKLAVEPILGDGLTVRKPIAEAHENIGPPEAENEEPTLPHTDLVSVRPRRIGGRPRKWRTEADRLRAYRARGTHATAEGSFQTGTLLHYNESPEPATRVFASNCRNPHCAGSV